MGTPEPDQYQTGVLINGLPTCVFRPRPYNRKIKRIIVTNTAPASTCNVYRGSLTSFAVATTLLGGNNTLPDDILVPKGQTFFVQWTVAGASVSGATARVTLERDDNPFEEAQHGTWSQSVIRDLLLPSNAGPNDPRLLLGPDVPAILVAYYAPGANTAFACELAYSNATDYQYTIWLVNLGTGELTKGEGWVSGNRVFELYYYYHDPASSLPRVVNFGDGFGSPGGGLGAIGWSFNGEGFDPTNITTYSNVEFFNTDITANFRSLGRGWILLVSGTATQTVSAPGPGTLATDPGSTVYKNGRAYRARIAGHWSCSIVGQYTQLDLRTGGGVTKASIRSQPLVTSGAPWVEYEFLFRNSSGGDFNTGMNVQALPTAGTLAFAVMNNNQPWYFIIEDIGAAADYAAFPTL
jgi:hypothetical protein